jgi:hypothetical protein
LCLKYYKRKLFGVLIVISNDIVQLNGNFLLRYDNLHTFVQTHFDLIIKNIRSSHNVDSDDIDSVVDVAISIDGTVLLLYD